MEKMSNLIDRRAAIDALMEIMDRPHHADFLYTDEICKALNELPSAQPEIVRCEDDCDPWGNPLKVRLEIEGSAYEVLAKDLRNALNAVVKNGKYTRVTTWAISKEPNREDGEA